MVDGNTPLLWQVALAVVQVDEEQGQRGEALLAVNDVALAFFLAEDDRAEKVMAIFGDCFAVMAGLIVFEKLPHRSSMSSTRCLVCHLYSRW